MIEAFFGPKAAQASLKFNLETGCNIYCIMNSSNKTPGPNTRIPVNIPVQVSVMDMDNRAILSEALTINVSRSGACMRLGVEASPEAPLIIYWQDERGSHEAKTCLKWKQQRDGQWHVGVEALDHPYLWTQLFNFLSQPNDNRPGSSSLPLCSNG